MRFFSEPNRGLRAAVLPLSVVAVGGALLAGCGSGGSTAPIPGAPLTSSGGIISGISGGISSSFAGRSYMVSGLALAGGRTGTVTLQVASNNTITGVVSLTNPTDSVALTGTLDSTTGTYRLTGALNRAPGDPVVVQGTLPAPPATVGGSISITIGGQTVTASFSLSSSTTPTPTPSGATPTPTPTPSGSTPTPTTTPTPNPTPSGTGSGILGDYYTAFLGNMNDTFTYKFTNTDTQTPDPNGVSNTNTNQATIKGGFLFGLGFNGQKTTVTITLPVSGSKTVTRQEQLNPKTGALIGYNYFTEDATGRTAYGSDSLFNNVVQSSTRFDPGEGAPYSLAPGQSYSETFTVYETEYDFTGKLAQQDNYVEQEKVTFVGIETTSVTAGTYTNVAHVRVETSYTQPAGSSIAPGSAQPTTESVDFYVSKIVGLVRETNHTVTQNVTGRDNATGSAYTYTDTTDGVAELLSATVGGTNYPPGRHATVSSSGGTIPPFAYFPPRRH